MGKNNHYVVDSFNFPHTRNFMGVCDENKFVRELICSVSNIINSYSSVRVSLTTMTITLLTDRQTAKRKHIRERQQWVDLRYLSIPHI